MFQIANNRIPEVPGSLSNIHAQFACLIQMDHDPSYAKRASTANNLANFIINAPIGSDITSPQAANTLLVTYELVLEGALQDFAGAGPFKQSIIKIIAAIGYSYRYGAQPFFQWLFERILTPKTNVPKEAELALKMGLLLALKELLSLSFATNPPPKLHEHLIAFILFHLQTLLDSMESPDLLPCVLDVLIVVSEKYPVQFGGTFQEILTLLIGWQIDPKVSKQVASIISDGFKRFNSAWLSHLPFSLELISNLTRDLEMAYADEPAANSGRISGSITALVLCCIGVCQGVCAAIFENQTTCERIPAKVKADCLALVQTLLDIMSNVAITCYGDRVLRTIGFDFVRYLSVCLGPNMTSLQYASVKILFADIERFSHEPNEVRDANALKFTDSWLQCLDALMSSWGISLHPNLLLIFMSPLNSLLLSKLRLICGRDKAASASISTSCRIWIRKICNAVGTFDQSSKYAQELLLEIVDISIELKTRRKVAIRPLMEQRGRLLAANHELSLGTQELLKYEDLIREIRGWEAAACLKSILLADISIALECLTVMVPGFGAPLVASIIEHVCLVDAETEYRSTDWWLKLESSMFSVIRESDSRLNLMSPAIHHNVPQAVFKFVTRLIDDSSTYTHFIVGAIWLRDILRRFAGNTRDSNEWQSNALPHLENVVFNLVPRLDFETDFEMRILLGELLQEAADAIDLSKKQFEFYLPIIRRLDDVHPEVQRSFSKIVPAMAAKLLKCKHVASAGVISHAESFKLSVMASANLGNFRWNHFEIVMQTLGIYPRSETLRPDAAKTLLRLFHICQASKVVSQATDLMDENDLKAHSNAYLSEDLLTYWALWESARFCVLSRLRTPFGNPEQTFSALGSAISGKKSKGLRNALCLIEMLELQIHNTTDGSSLSIPGPPKASAAFFYANKGVCEEWFAQIRPSLVKASIVLGEYGESFVKIGGDLMDQLSKSEKLANADGSNGLSEILAGVGASFVQLDYSEGFEGLQKLAMRRNVDEGTAHFLESCKQRTNGAFDNHLSTLIGMIPINEVQKPVYDMFLRSLATSNHHPLDFKIALKDSHFADSFAKLQTWGNLAVSTRAAGPTSAALDPLTCLSTQHNSLARLPVLSFPKSPESATVLKKVVPAINLIVKDVLHQTCIDSALNPSAHAMNTMSVIEIAEALSQVFQTKSFTGVSCAWKAPNSIETVALKSQLFKAIADSGSQSLDFEASLFLRKQLRNSGLFRLAQSVAESFEKYPMSDVQKYLDKTEAAKLEYAQTKSVSSLVQLSSQDPTVSTAPLISKVSLSCFKRILHLKRLESVATSDQPQFDKELFETRLAISTHLTPDYSKAWLLSANFYFEKGLAQVSEIRSKAPIEFLKDFTRMYAVADQKLMSFEEFVSKTCTVLIKGLESVRIERSDSATLSTAESWESCINALFPEDSVPEILNGLKEIKAKILKTFSRSTDEYFRFLKLEGHQSQKAEHHMTVVFRLLRLLTTFGDDLENAFDLGSTEFPTSAWHPAVPQLFSCLLHSNASVRNCACKLLCKIGTQSPGSIVYHCAVGLTSSNAQKYAALKSLYIQVQAAIGVTYVDQVAHFIAELCRMTVLWEERWFNLLVNLNSTAAKKLQQFAAEFNRCKDESGGESLLTAKEKYDIILYPIISPLEKMVESTFSIGAVTPHEAAFSERFQECIASAIQVLKSPEDLGSVKSLWDPFLQITNDISKSLQTNKTLQSSRLSPKLKALVDLSVPLPFLGVDETILQVHSFRSNVTVLPTKTKPKKVDIWAADGRKYSFLLKGHEDLHLDERIQQFLKATNSLLEVDKDARKSGLCARSYEVIPLGDEIGMIQWVERVGSFFSIFKRWQSRNHSAKHASPGKDAAAEAILRPNEIFNAKVSTALKKAGISRSVPRPNWPPSILENVFRELCQETPATLIKNELWATSATAARWWQKTKNFAHSSGVNSVIGYIIGLGDRHLDNVLIDGVTGEVVHIDYNVCFEKGLRLRVPETVPFRLTQNIVGGFGISGVEGGFRESSEKTLKVLRQKSDVLMSLLDSLAYDPISDWITDEDAEEERIKVLVLNLKLVSSRISEAKKELLTSTASITTAISAAVGLISEFSRLSTDRLQMEELLAILIKEWSSVKSKDSKGASKEEPSKLLPQSFAISGTWISRHQDGLTELRANPTKKGYEQLISSLRECINAQSSAEAEVSAKVEECVASVAATHYATRLLLKPLHTVVDTVIRGSQNLVRAEAVHKQLKSFWGLWPYLGSAIKRWRENLMKYLASKLTSVETAAILVKRAAWILKGANETVRVFASSLHSIETLSDSQLVLTKGYTAASSQDDHHWQNTVDGDAEKQEHHLEDDERDDIESSQVELEEEELNNEEVAGESQKLEISNAVNKEKSNVGGQGKQPQGTYNAQGLSVLGRVRLKLEGKDNSTDAESMSVAAQVDMIIQEAQNVDNLKNMYEGWMSWI
ncbi:Serine/threonine-protein kinase smg1 [Chytriomyces hyalinus]|nr:Serine/threonine-protein kinase smg1 [Chytriomyces hyalinus]